MAMEHLYGFNAVMAAIRLRSRHRLTRLLVYHRPPENDKLTPSQGQAKMAAIIKAAHQLQLPIQYCSKREIDALAKERPHQNVILEAASVKLERVNELPTKGRHLLLHSVGDPQNLGSILRTALLMSVDGVYLTGACAPLSPVVAKASSGALEELFVNRRLFQIGSLAVLSKSQIPVLAAVCDGGDLSTPVSDGLLLVGSEGKGLPESIAARATHRVTLPMAASDHVDSFNISVATALLINKVFLA